MKPFLTFCLSFWVLIVFADPSHPKAQRGKVTFLSSEMWSDVTSESKKYPVRNIVDNNPLTAWVFEPNASSQKEVIGMAMVFSESLMIDGIRIINGYAKSEYLYKANSSIESFELILSTGETIKYECSKSLEEQKFQFAAQELDWIILVVKNIRQGTKYTDLCISELTVTFDGANIIKESQDVIITNEGGEYESDKIYTLKNEMKFDTGIWDFGC